MLLRSSSVSSAADCPDEVIFLCDDNHFTRTTFDAINNRELVTEADELSKKRRVFIQMLPYDETVKVKDPR